MNTYKIYDKVIKKVIIRNMDIESAKMQIKQLNSSLEQKRFYLWL